MFSGQNGGSYTATAMRRLVVERAGNSIVDGWISRHSKQLKENAIKQQFSLTYVNLCIKTGRQVHLLVRIEAKD